MVDLAGDFSGATEITSLSPGAAFGFNFVLEGPNGVTPYIVTIGGAFRSGTLFDASDPNNLVEGMTASGLPRTSGFVDAVDES